MSDIRTTRARQGILLYGMYDLAVTDRAPTVRIAMMTRALASRAHMERIVGGRLGRFGAAVRWLASAGPRRVGAVYVESPTSSAMPTDLIFLALMRLLGKPVGVYFRDAYQLFRDVRPRSSRRQIVSDWLWRVSTPLLKRIATVRYAPSSGLAEALKLSKAVLLPPGTDPELPALGPGRPDNVAAVVQVAPRSGFDQLVAAMRLVRGSRPGARLRVVTRAFDPSKMPDLPDWVELVPSTRSSLAELLADARVCVLPLPMDAYHDLAVPVRLLDLLALGKPIVATDMIETRALLRASGAGIATPDTPAGLAAGIVALLDDESRAAECSRRARAYACSPANTWDARARTVLATLGVAETAAPAAATEEAGHD